MIQTMKHRIIAPIAIVLTLAAIAGCATEPNPVLHKVATTDAVSATPEDGATAPNPALHDVAVVRAVHGYVSNSFNGITEKTRPNFKLPSGTMIATSHDSYVDLQVNGRASIIRVTADSSVNLVQMDSFGNGPAADTQTKIKLISGTILGSVRKLAANSTYEIITPDGIVGIRGTDFEVSVQAQNGGSPRSTYRCVTGQIVVQSTAFSGDPVTQILNTGESWTPGKGVTHVEKEKGGIEEFPVRPIYDMQMSLPPPPAIQQPFNGNGPPNLSPPSQLSPQLPPPHILPGGNDFNPPLIPTSTRHH